VTNEVLFLRVIDPAGSETFRIGTPRSPYLGIRRPFASDYNGILDGFMIEAAFDPAAAGDLVIGGLPRSRLPSLLGLLALTAGLMAIAVLQVRREYALSDLRSQFVSRVSHELRTPLAQIRMFAETLLLNRVRNDDERRRSLEIIDRESRRLTHLIENVLRFSRRERGENRVDAIAQNAAPLIREILVDFQPLLRGGTQLSSSIPDEAFALLDESALRQILLNFLDNATKYGPEGQRIRLELRTGNENVLLSVEDGGPGIPPSERSRIWQPYYRLPRDRESAVAGTGIGLSVVADLARLQGGRVWVESGGGGGARFVLELRSAHTPLEVSR
jgi:signal transduction histidine kinase